MGNLPLASLIPGFGVYPGQDLCVTESLFDLGFEGFGINSRKLKKALVRRAGIVVFTALSGQGSPAFVQATWQNSLATKTDAGAARWMLCEIR